MPVMRPLFRADGRDGMTARLGAPLLFGVGADGPGVLPWLAQNLSALLTILVSVLLIAALAGMLSSRQRRRTAMAFTLAEAARQEAVTARDLAERFAGRALALQRMTGGLAEAVTVRDVAQVVLGAGIEAMMADGGAVAILDENGTNLRIVEMRGDDPGMVGGSNTIPRGVRAMLTEPLRTGVPVFVSSADDLRRRFPIAGAMVLVASRVVSGSPRS